MQNQMDSHIEHEMETLDPCKGDTQGYMGIVENQTEHEMQTNNVRIILGSLPQ